jgi:hypothetical protein
MEHMILLNEQLKAALKQHWRHVHSLYDDIDGYALFSDDTLDSGLTIAWNRRSSLPNPDGDDFERKRFLADEWNEWDTFSYLDATNRILTTIFDEDSSRTSRNRVLRVCLDAMIELESEGVFGSKSDDRFITLCLSDSDDEIMFEAAQILNTQSAYSRFRKLF